MQQRTHCFILCFKSYLCSIGRVRNASDADIYVIFRNSIFFVYRRSDLDGSCWNGTETRHVDHVVVCGPQRVTRSDIGLHDLKHLRKRIVERMMRVLVRSGLRGGFTVAFFRGGVWGVKCCWNRCSSI